MGEPDGRDGGIGGRVTGEKDIGDKATVRDKKGRFLPGHAPTSPGRPKGKTHYDVLAICKRMAKEDGADIEKLIWAVMRGMAIKGSKGDSAAAKVFLDRVCGPAGKDPEVQVNIDARQVADAAAQDPEDIQREFAKAVRIMDEMVRDKGEPWLTERSRNGTRDSSS